MHAKKLTITVRTQRVLAALFAGLLMAGWPPHAEAASEAARDALRKNPNLMEAPDSVLVRFKPGTPPTAKAEARRRANGQMVCSFGIVPGLEHMLVPRGNVEKAIAVLQALPNVAYAEPDYVVRPVVTLPNDPYFGNLWGLHNASDNDINAPEAWDVSTGSGNCVVADIDTGVQYDHPDLIENMWVNTAELNGVTGVDDDGNGYVDDMRGWDFYSEDNDPMDTHGHGTHTSGTIGATGNNGIGVAGVAWHVKIMALRFLGPSGGYTSDAVRALNYAVMMGVKVSNNSWGGGGYSTALYDAIASAGVAGHLFVAAAGNDGINTDTTPHYPSSYTLQNVLSVAAVDANFNRASFSNYGSNSVDLGAPGVSILSTYKSGGYAYMSGTSMATPHVAGVAALLHDLNPGWGYLEVRDQIMGSVRPVASMEGITVSGGVLDAATAIGTPPTLPAAPSGLQVTGVTASSIDLAWTDNADNEQGFDIKRSEGDGKWALVGNVGPNTTAFADGGLQPSTPYSYVVCAYNAAGPSVDSNVAEATTVAAPNEVDEGAVGETVVASGAVAGSYVDTWTGDGTAEAITEGKSGGKPSSRYSYLEHRWTFEVRGGGTVTFFVNAYAPPSADGDEFVFAYSTDGASFTDMTTVNATEDDGTYAAYALPAETRGTVIVRVTDTDHAAGHLDMDTLYVDHMFIRSMFEPGVPPAAPSELTVEASSPSTVTLVWTDNADSELGFAIERSADGGESWDAAGSVGANETTFNDSGLQPLTTYEYRVQAYNASGVSGYSGTATVTTPEGFVLSAEGYKVKAMRMVDLSWSGGPGGDTTVDIYRNGVVIATVPDTGSYTDEVGARGSFTYQVCETGEPGNCSNEATVTF